MQDNFQLDKGKEAVISGIKKTTGLIKGTYGPAGGNVVVEHAMSPHHLITNDGKIIVDSVHLVDRYENIGANIIKEAGDIADKDSGDGRKTTMILTEAIFIESAKENELPMVINRSLNECIPILFNEIDAHKKTITVDEVGPVAAISSEDQKLGAMIQEIYKQIGEKGVIEVDHAHLPDTYFEVTEGVRLRGAKYYGEYALTEPGKAIVRNAHVLITKDKITSVDQLDQIIGGLKQRGVNELVIFFDDIDMSVASRLALTHLKGGFKTLLIKAPTLWKDWAYEDFAKITGATIVDAKQGKTFKNFVFTDVGVADKITVDKDETRVMGIKDISEHIAYLESLNTDDARLRITWLQTKVAILRIGANSESELAYKFKKAKDACNAAYLALKDGVVVGGGLALINAAKVLDPDTVGGRILMKALVYPTIQNMRNAGKDDFEIEDAFREFTDTKGFDARGNEIVDMFEKGILDPSLVVKNAIKNSISIASTVGTSKGVTTIPRELYENNRQMPSM